MKTVRTLCCTLRLLTAAPALVAPLVATTATATSIATIAAALVACDDENDPATWVKRLDDPAQRANAIKRLQQFYEDDMTRASNDQSAPEVKTLLDTIIDPLTKQYTGGGLDDLTRTDLIKFLAETHDPRTQPALAKALKDFEMGKTDDEVRVSCESINAMAKAGVKLDKTLIDPLWDTFSKFQLSKATSQRLYQSLHDAIVNVHDISYGDKAIEKLKAPAIPDNVDSQKDQISWWQLTSIQVISELRYAPAVKQLVLVLLTPTKIDLNASTRMSLLKMAKAAEPELIKALNGQDDAYNKAGEAFKDKTNLAIVADTLGLLSRTGGRDAILAALPNADTDTTKTAFAQALVQFPTDPRVEPAFLAAYNKIPWSASVELLGPLKPRAALAQAAASLYDPNLTDWLVKETVAAPDAASKLLPIESALKLMPPNKKGDVLAALQKAKAEMPADVFQASKQIFDFVGQATDKCGTNSACYLGVLDEPIPSSPTTANMRAVKAAWMATIYGQASADQTRGELLKRVDKIKDASARLAVVEAVDWLAPRGDTAAADALDKIVAADTKNGDKSVLMADDSVVKIALRLRARAAP
ncbi:MAG TPA: hypothetical protein VH044_15975 [Polyangiaceae bacterium]|jgi:hypothetical protein|nr:hypothetical protein [Polyangiaceae bacterium]